MLLITTYGYLCHSMQVSMTILAYHKSGGEIKSRSGPFPMTGILSLLFVTNCSLCLCIFDLHP